MLCCGELRRRCPFLPAGAARNGRQKRARTLWSEMRGKGGSGRTTNSAEQISVHANCVACTEVWGNERVVHGQDDYVDIRNACLFLSEIFSTLIALPLLHPLDCHAGLLFKSKKATREAHFGPNDAPHVEVVFCSGVVTCGVLRVVRKLCCLCYLHRLFLQRVWHLFWKLTGQGARAHFLSGRAIGYAVTLQTRALLTWLLTS